MYFWILYMFFVCVTTSLKLNSNLNSKFCVDCKYFIQSSVSNEYGKCSLFPIPKLESLINNPKLESLIINNPKLEYLINNDNFHYNYNRNNENDYMYCYTARNYDNLCGKNGTKYNRFYE